MNEAVFKSILHKVRGSEGTSRTDGPRQISDPKTPTAETLAASILAENGPDEVDSILRIWSDLFGKRLDHESVRNQLTALREWQSKWISVRSRTAKEHA